MVRGHNKLESCEPVGVYDEKGVGVEPIELLGPDSPQTVDQRDVHPSVQRNSNFIGQHNRGYMGNESCSNNLTHRGSCLPAYLVTTQYKLLRVRAVQAAQPFADGTEVSNATIVSEARFTEPGVGEFMPLTEDSIRSIVAIADVALRNLWITQSYADLANRFLSVLRTDQTWCTFAIWASNTAGVSIRGEELPSLVTSLLRGDDSPVDAIVGRASLNFSAPLPSGLSGELRQTHVEHLLTQAVGQVSARIANGNTLVFAELAPLFVRFLHFLARVGAPAANEIDSRLDDLGFPSAQQKPLVRQAFRHYALAVGSADPRSRAQHVLTANIAAVLHEQQRLQNDITAALNAGLIDVGADLSAGAHRLLAHRLADRVIREVRIHVASHAEELWQCIATHLLMTMSLPGETLHLSHDVPLLRGRRQLFPDFLKHLDQPQLVQLMADWDPTHGSGHGSGARDWSDLHQRMGYIVNLFRSRQQFLALTVPPFTSSQLGAMVSYAQSEERLPARLVSTSSGERWS